MSTSKSCLRGKTKEHRMRCGVDVGRTPCEEGQLTEEF